MNFAIFIPGKPLVANVSNIVQRSLADVTKEKYLDKYFKNICKFWTVESQLERLWRGTHENWNLEEILKIPGKIMHTILSHICYLIMVNLKQNQCRGRDNSSSKAQARDVCSTAVWHWLCRGAPVHWHWLTAWEQLCFDTHTVNLSRPPLSHTWKQVIRLGNISGMELTLHCFRKVIQVQMKNN